MSEKHNNWTFNNGVYRQHELATQKDKLVNGIYLMDADMMSPYLSPMGSKFTFPYEIYGKPDPIIARTVKHWKATDGNLGVLLTGHKGSGKTVNAKLLANAMNLPIIMVNKPFDFLPDWISDIPQDVVIFLDEYEKVFQSDKKEGLLLSVMDGAMSGRFRRLFLMTTNELSINYNMKHRPSRIRYIKEYKDLPPDVIEEMLDKLLLSTRKRWKNALFDFVKRLEYITFDAVNTLIHEVNIHNEPPEKFASFFNLKKHDIKYMVYTVTQDPDFPDKELVRPYRRDAEIMPRWPFADPDSLDRQWIYINHDSIGRFMRMEGDNRFVVKDFSYNSKGTEVTYEIRRNSGYHSMFDTDRHLFRKLASAYGMEDD